MSSFKFIRKGNRAADNNNTTQTPNVVAPTPNTITALTAGDLEIQGKSLYIKKNGNLLAHLILSEIVSWNVLALSLVIYSLDDVPIILSFTNTPNLESALTLLEGAINAQ
jgi:hypothetical protein